MYLRSTDFFEDFYLLLSGKTIQGGKSVDLLMCETHCACQFEELVRTV